MFLAVPYVMHSLIQLTPSINIYEDKLFPTFI